jgi:hypothetical protein
MVSPGNGIYGHNSWQRDKVFKGLTKRGAGFCLCDMPDISRLPEKPPICWFVEDRQVLYIPVIHHTYIRFLLPYSTISIFNLLIECVVGEKI